MGVWVYNQTVQQVHLVLLVGKRHWPVERQKNLELDLPESAMCLKHLGSSTGMMTEWKINNEINKVNQEA